MEYEYKFVFLIFRIVWSIIGMVLGIYAIVKMRRFKNFDNFFVWF